MQTAKILNFPRKVVWLRRRTSRQLGPLSHTALGNIGGISEVMDTRRGGSICPVSSGPPIHSDHRLALVETEESTILVTPPTSRCFYALARQLPITCTYPILLNEIQNAERFLSLGIILDRSFWRRAFQSGTRASRAAVSPKGDSERVERVDREVAPVFRSFERIEASRQRGGVIGRSGAYARFGSLHASGHVRTRGGGVAATVLTPHRRRTTHGKHVGKIV